MKRNNLFKYLLVIACLVFCVFLSSCGETEINATLKVSGNNVILPNETTALEVEIINGEKGNTALTWTSSDENVAIVKDGVVKGIKKGEATITVTYMEKFQETFSIKVTDAIESIKLNVNTLTLDCNDNFQLSYTVTPSSLNPKVKYTSSDEKVVKVSENGLVTTSGTGEATITIETVDDVYSSYSILVKVIDKVLPEVTFLTEQNVRVAWNSNWDPLSDIKVVDNIDGDITNKVKIINKNDFDLDFYGTHSIIYSVEDSAHNEVVFSRNVEIYWPYATTLIAHGGGYYGIMNTEEAIRYSIEVLHYPMIEVDVLQTKDGVFVLSHDATFGDYKISDTNYEDLKDVEITKTRNSGYPKQLGMVKKSSYTSKICTLATALEICKKYNTGIKIELKESKGINHNSTDRMQALMDFIAQYNMMDLVSFTTIPYLKNTLIWLRDHGYKNELQYLAATCESQETLDFCKEYGITVSINVTYGNYSNSEEWIKKFHDEGVKLSAFTFQYSESYEDCQKWIDLGIEYLTCDWYDPKLVKMPLANN